MPMSKPQRDILTEKITNTFIWDFKKGDNIIYNFEILWALYEAKIHYKGNKLLFNKPITITIISIIECILDDFIRRIKRRVSDALPNISSAVADDFKYKRSGQTLAIKKLEKFNHYIDISEKHNIFGTKKIFYQVLRNLRDIRNKVHIQDSGEDEDRIFTDKNLTLSEKVLGHIIKVMIVAYPRWDKKTDDKDIPYPWRILIK